MLDKIDSKAIAKYVQKEIKRQTFSLKTDGKIDMGGPTVGTVKSGDTGSLPPSVFSYSSNITFTSNTWNQVSWNQGEVSWIDGRQQDVAAGNKTLTGTHYFYIVFGSSVLLDSISYSDAVGLGKALVGVAKIASSSSQKAYSANQTNSTITINSDQLVDNIITELKIANDAVTDSKIQSLAAHKINAGTLAAGVIYAGTIETIQINAASLSAINANMGTLTAGSITLGRYDGGNFTGLRMYKYDDYNFRLEGVSGNVAQAYFDSDGALKAGAGAVKLDASGITIKGQTFYINDANDTNMGYVSGVGGSLTIAANGVSPAKELILGGYPISMVGNVLPWVMDNNYDLGSSGLRWKNLWAVTTHFGDAVFANDWRLTETENGVKLIRPDGSTAQEWS